MNVHNQNDKVSQNIPLLELDLLKTLIAIAETGNFSAAAEVVFRTPSAVSMQVKRIEEILGRPIFKRDSRSVDLTSDGVLLLEHARRVLALNREMMSKFVAPEVSGTVRLGLSDDIAERYLTDLLRRFDVNHPCVVLDVKVDRSVALVDSLKSGSIDIAIANNHPDMSVANNGELLVTDELVWAGLKGGVAGEQTPLPICIWEEGCCWRHEALQSVKAAKRDYRIAFQSAHIAGQKSAILADLVIAPMPRSSLNGPIVEVGELYGLPKMGFNDVELFIGDNPSDSVLIAAEHIRASFAFNARASSFQKTS